MTITTTEPGLILQGLLNQYFDVTTFVEYEIDWDWGNGQTQGALVDHDWLWIAATGADRVFRWRGRFKLGHWSSWSYVYAPEYIMVPEEMR